MGKKKKRKIKHGKCVKQVGFWTPIRFLAETLGTVVKFIGSVRKLSHRSMFCIYLGC